MISSMTGARLGCHHDTRKRFGQKFYCVHHRHAAIQNVVGCRWFLGTLQGARGVVKKWHRGVGDPHVIDQEEKDVRPGGCDGGGGEGREHPDRKDGIEEVHGGGTDRGREAFQEFIPCPPEIEGVGIVR